MIENIEAVENIDEILSVGVDATFIGPFDLSASLGCPTEWDHPQFLQALGEFKKGCKRNNVPMGYHIPGNHLSKDPMVEFSERRKEGYTFLTYSGDVNMNLSKQNVDIILKQ
tara:strand:+ start:98 stop:433 length:336 start_codon:yes stop_codon:yes gene_type:complete